MKTKVFLLLIVIAGIAKQAWGQKAPKTLRIISDSSHLLKKSDTLAFIPPYIFTARTRNIRNIDSTNYLFFEDSTELSENIKNAEVEEYYRNCCYFWFRYRFDPPAKYTNDSDITIPKATKYTKHSKTYVPIISDEDYKSIYYHLKKIEKVFNDSVVSSELKMDDELFQSLSKYSSSLCVLTDIKEYWYDKVRWASGKQVVCLYRCVVFDMKKKVAFYYNSIIKYNKYGPAYNTQSGTIYVKFEKSSLAKYTNLQPISYMMGGLLRVRKKKN